MSLTRFAPVRRGSGAAPATKLGLTYSKQETLALYAEMAYYGQGFYGLHVAACGYFGRPPARLAITQAALLAGLVNAPSADDPVTHPAAAPSRERHVLARMAATGYLSQAQVTSAMRQPLRLNPGGQRAAPGCRE